VARDPQSLRAELLAALADPAVRVREAAVEALASPAAGFAVGALAERLGEDDWPLVRAAAARALGRHGPSPAANQALGRALDDDSHHVRIPVLLAIGMRRVSEHVERVRELLADRQERLEVRAAAALSLGLGCDQGSLDELTERARKLADPAAPAEERALGGAALAALAQLHPADFRKRLQPLLEPRAAVDVRAAAERALRARGTCRKARR
jgi:HEAT repeat protein